MGRDNFRDLTKSDLARNAHLHCVFPGCPNATHGPTDSGDRSINVGNAAHAAAASPNGPRFDSKMTPEQRKAYDNGAWLCAHHATLIDQDPEGFPVEVIREWQAAATARSRDALTGRYLHVNIGFEEVCSKIEAFLREANQVYITIFRGQETVMEINNDSVAAIGRLVSQCSGGSWRPTNKFHSLDQTTSSIQERAIRALNRIYNEVNDSSKWHNNGYSRIIIGAREVFSLTPQHEIDRIQTTAARVAAAHKEYLECLRLLREYSSGRRSR